MIGWVAFAVLAVVFASTLFWVRGRMQQTVAQLEGDHRQRVAALTDEADARTARVERASRAQAERLGVALAEDLLPVADALKSAVELDDSASTRDVRDGVELARRELARAFEAHGIVGIEPAAGDQFDPVRHEAVEMVGTGNEIVRLHRPGYAHGERILRSAMVSVGGEVAETNPEPADPADEMADEIADEIAGDKQKRPETRGFEA